MPCLSSLVQVVALWGELTEEEDEMWAQVTANVDHLRKRSAQILNQIQV